MNLIQANFLSGFDTGFSLIVNFIPKLAAGLIILLIGIIVASLIKDLLGILFKYIRLETWLEKAGLAKSQEIIVWPNLFKELVRWLIIFIFLMSAVEVWQVPRVGDILGQLLAFLPNVLISVIIGWIGLVLARIFSDIVRHSVQGIGGKEALILGNLARYSIIFFTALIILTQLGVAADLIKILFTGIVGMLALAFGLAFGLGGQEEAKDLLKKLRKKIER